MHLGRAVEKSWGSETSTNPRVGVRSGSERPAWLGRRLTLAEGVVAFPRPPSRKTGSELCVLFELTSYEYWIDSYDPRYIYGQRIVQTSVSTCQATVPTKCLS